MYIDNFDNFFQENENEYITADEVNASYYGDYSSYIDNKYKTILGEVGLWRAVLLQAFVDLKSKSKKKRNQNFIREAKEWFIKKENKNDIKQICEMAHYNYNSVHKLANDIIKERYGNINN